MKSNRTTENLTLPDMQITEVAEENKPFHSDRRKTKLRELLLSLSCKLDELARVNNRLFRMITPSEKKELDGDDPGFSKFLLMTPSPDALTEPVLTYRLSSLLDLVRGLYGFENCGVFLLDHRKGGLERLVLSPGPTGYETLQEFEEEVKAFWRRGHISCATVQKRRMVLPAKKEGEFVIIPFKVLDEKDGFWVAHFKQATAQKNKKSADLLFWVELLASLIENSYLKKSALSPQKEKSYHIETERLLTTVELSRAVVHEINNCLQVVLGRSQLLKMAEKKSPMTPSNIGILETIEGNANRVCSILKDFSDHLHRQFDETTEAGEVNIQHILKSNLVLVKYILKSNRIRLELNLDEDLPTVYGNPGELEIAFLSLIRGLRDHLSCGGSIRLQTSTEDGSPCLSLYCTGEDIQKDGYPDFTDLRANDRFKMVSQILRRYDGDLGCEELSEREVKFSLRFSITTERSPNREDLQELKL